MLQKDLLRDVRHIGRSTTSISPAPPRNPH